MLMTLKKKPIVNWRHFKPGSAAHRRRLVMKLNEFLSAPQKHTESLLVKLAELTAPGDTSAWDSVVNAITAIQEDVGQADMGWQTAFDEVDLRNSNKSSFDIVGMSSGLTFSKVHPGAPAKIYSISGTNINVKVDLYGGGLGYLRVWWDDQEYYKVEEQSRDFLYKYNEQQASIMYALITAITDAVARVSSGSTTAENDVETINAGCAELIVDNRGSLPGINDNMTFLLYHHPNYKSRINAALRTVIPDTTATKLVYTVQPVSSTYIGTGYLGQLVAPGIKNKFGRRMDLSVFSQMDIIRFAETVVGWGRYGGYVNSSQVRRIPHS